jgi:hypothetical protein
MLKGQALQDKFVLSMLDNKRYGWFLELGSQHPIDNNNTYILESEYNWRGIMVEYDNSWLDSYKTHRQNSLHVIGDARTIDYSSLFSSNLMPKSIDYLQIDLDVDNASTLDTLLKIDEQLLDEYKFATITLEHDFYSSDLDNDIWAVTRKRSRELFQRRGYVLMFPDVRLPSDTTYRGKQCGAFEDWYVHPDLVRRELIDKYKTEESLFFKDIVFE